MELLLILKTYYLIFSSTLLHFHPIPSFLILNIISSPMEGQIFNKKSDPSKVLNWQNVLTLIMILNATCIPKS
jgi:hypothetical protein